MVLALASLQWLLEEDESGARYLALKDLVGLPNDHPDLVKARKVAYSTGQIGKILSHMKPEGYWNKPGGGYSPKYYSTVWSLILLSQLGASVDDDERIAKGCRYYIDQALSPDGSISHNGTRSGTFDCLQGNMCAALTILGFKDKRLDETYEWMARSEIGKIERYYSAKSGPNFACGANGKKPCAWGCVKVMLALGTLPRSTWSQDIKSAVKAGADFLFSVDPLTAAYPTAFNTTPNRSWWQLGFPTFYCTDLLQLAEVLTLTGYGHDKRLRGVIDFIKSKQDSQGRWRLEHNYIGKTWGGFGKKGELNKWVTTRALKLFTLLDAD